LSFLSCVLSFASLAGSTAFSGASCQRQLGLSERSLSLSASLAERQEQGMDFGFDRTMQAFHSQRQPASPKHKCAQLLHDVLPFKNVLCMTIHLVREFTPLVGCTEGELIPQHCNSGESVPPGRTAELWRPCHNHYSFYLQTRNGKLSRVLLIRRESFPQELPDCGINSAGSHRAYTGRLHT